MVEKGNSKKQSTCNTKDSELEVNLIEIIKPQDLDEALNSPQATEWKQAIKEEIKSLDDQETWEIVDSPPGK